jgi:hypothetical protein
MEDSRDETGWLNGYVLAMKEEFKEKSRRRSE